MGKINNIKEFEKLYELGLNEEIINQWKSEFSKYSLGRITAQYRNLYKIVTESSEVTAVISGKMNYELMYKKDFPAVGDWVVIDEIKNGDSIIHDILPRKTMISRKVAGAKSEEQVLAVNVDKVFITMSLNHDFNVRRLERYINIAWDSGAIPVIILTKADLYEDVEEQRFQLEEVAFGIDIVSVSAFTGDGLEEVRSLIGVGKTVVFIGSSGVGKSTLINKLLGEDIQLTKGIGFNDKGRHTTTSRELFVMDEGGIIIDTPGMRELQLSQGDIEATFSDIEALAHQCYFSDCTHRSEPRCAIKEAIRNGQLSIERFKSYEKLLREIRNEEKRRAAKEKINERKSQKRINK
ncbi:MAG: ribosome small subunit-dependent GTPase A [Clostridium sp.]